MGAKQMKWWWVAAMVAGGALSACGGGGEEAAPVVEAPVPAAPAITQALQDVSAQEGDLVQFELGVTSATDFAWSLGDKAVDGPGEASMVLTADASMDGMTVSVKASNALGAVTSSARLTVLPAATQKAAAQVVGSLDHNLALTRSGQVLAWGVNTTGQLGDGTTTNRLAPVPVRASANAQLTGVVSVSAAPNQSFAVLANGTVLSWGKGQALPKPFTDGNGKPLTNIAAVSVADSYRVLLTKDGTVLTLGVSSFRGNPKSVPNEASLVVDSTGAPLRGIVAVSASPLHALALSQQGTVFAWGENVRGQLGNNVIGLRSAFAVPVLAANGSALTGIRAISAGLRSSFALRNDGSALAWGFQAFGSLGNKLVQGNALLPTAVLDANGRPVTGLSGLAANNLMTLALDSKGCVLAWGDNARLQLGQQAFTGRLRADAAAVHADAAGAPLCGIAGISSGSFHSRAYAFKQNGALVGWGLNDGKLGDGGTTAARVPVPIKAPL